jgi:hypothetical protein
MQGKLTLITPPDIFENSNESILFVHLSDEEQETISKWLANNTVDADLNLYVYDGEPNTSWFLYALSRCEHKYINLDGLNYVTQALSGYALGKSGVHYSITNNELANVYNHINHNRVGRVEEFLERIFSG